MTLPIHELEQSHQDLIAKADAIVAAAEKANRELNDSERKELDAILDVEVPKVKDALDDERRKRSLKLANFAPRMSAQLEREMGERGLSSPSKAGLCGRDSTGREVYMLSRGQKVADTLDKPIVQNGFGELIRASITGRVDSWAPDAVQAALSGNNPLQGGFLVPGELAANVIDLARNRSVLLQAGVRTVPMQTSMMTMARVMSDPTFEAKAENAAFTGSDINFGAIELKASTIGTVITASRELAEDAPNFAEVIEGVLARSLAAELDKLALQGAGSGTIRGLLSASEISETGSVGGLVWEDLAAAASKVRQNNHEPNGFVLGVEPHEDLMVSTGGDGSSSTKTWLMAPPSLEGQNLWPTNNCPLAQAICGDFTQAMWGIRSDARIEATTEADESFDRHQVKMKIVFRGDFNVMDPSAFHRLAGITS